MSAKDLYHDTVKKALIKDGWTITHDPYTLTFGQRNVYVDLGAEQVLGAEKGEEPIARPVIEDLNIHLITFDPQKERIIQWTP